MKYSRRQFLQHFTFLTTGLLLSNTSQNLLTDSPSDLVGSRPNIIFIMCDDLGYGELGCYGQTTIQTPNLDNFAAEGMKYTQAYAPCSVCAPTRWSLMTGKHIGHAFTSINEETYLRELNIVGNNRAILDTEGIAYLSEQDTTLAQLLKQAGYKTVCIGKWGLGGNYNNAAPTDKGFDYFFGYMTHVEAQQYYLDHLWENKTYVPINANENGGRSIYLPDLLCDKTLEFILSDHLSPFFLYLPYTIPHANILLESTGNGMEVPSDAPYTSEPWPQVEKNYAAMITRLDGYVGQIIQALKDKGIDQNTIVFFTSDNGPHNQGGHDYTFFNSAGSLRGHKEDLYEGGIRVPMLIRWPEIISAGTISDRLWCHYDLLPTALGLAGSPLPDDIDGVSFVPYFSGEEQAQHNFIYWAYGKPNGWYSEAVRVNNWKLVKTSPNAPVELYDIAIDPSESLNLAYQYPQVSQTLNRILTSFCPSPELCHLYLPKISNNAN
ncbi:MAG: arylsulfatase [Anaerolineae bacterium]|nr:arylsulfatase [Anaerolineae bacterium]